MFPSREDGIGRAPRGGRNLDLASPNVDSQFDSLHGGLTGKPPDAGGLPIRKKAWEWMLPYAGGQVLFGLTAGGRRFETCTAHQRKKTLARFRDFAGSFGAGCAETQYESEK
jgi:hypothetical protein